MDRLALQPLRLTKGQMIQYRIAQKKLNSEREDYLQAMDTILEAINEVSKSNEQLKAEIIKKINHIQDIELEIEKTPEEIKAALQNLRIATRRYTKYRQHVSDRAKGIMMSRLSLKLERLEAAITEMETEWTHSRTLVDEQKDAAKQFEQLSCLRRELISTNVRLRNETKRLFSLIDFHALVLNDDVFDPVKKLRNDLTKCENIKKSLIVDPRVIHGIAALERMEERLERASECVNVLEKLFGGSNCSRPTSQCSTRDFCSDFLRTDKIRMSILSDVCGFVMPFVPLNLSKLCVDSASKSANTSTTNLIELTTKLPQTARRPMYGTYLIHQDARISSDDEKTVSTRNPKFSSVLYDDENLTDALFGASEDKSALSAYQQTTLLSMSEDLGGGVGLLDDVPDLDPDENVIVALFNLALERGRLDMEVSDVEFSELNPRDIECEALEVDSQRHVVLRLREDLDEPKKEETEMSETPKPAKFARGTVRRKRRQSSASEVVMESDKNDDVSTKIIAFKNVRGTVRRRKRCLSDLDDRLWDRGARPFKSDSEVCRTPDKRESVKATAKRLMYTVSDVEVDVSFGSDPETDIPNGSPPKRISLIMFESDSQGGEELGLEEPDSAATFDEGSFSSDYNAPVLVEQQKPRHQSLLGKTAEGLAVYRSKSRFGNKVIKRNVIPTPPPPDKAQLEVTPTDSPPQHETEDLNAAPSQPEQDQEEQVEGSRPKAASNMSWANNLLKSAIAAQLSRTGASVAITDAKVKLAHINEEIQEMAEEKEMLDDCYFLRRPPVLRVTPVIENEYFSGEAVKPETTTDGVTCLMPGQEIQDIANEIAEMNQLLSKTVLLEQQKLLFDTHFPELQALHQRIGDQNRLYDKEIDDLERHLVLICPEDVLARRRRQRAQFEAARDEKLHILREMEGQLKKQEEHLTSLENKLTENRYLNQTLKKKVADEQRGEKADVMDLCSSRSALKDTDKGQREQIKQAEIEIAYYESEMNMNLQLLSEKSVSALQREVNGLRQTLNGLKDSFHQRLRRATRNRKVPYTHLPELSSLNSRTREIDAQMINLKRKQNMVNSRVQRLTQVLSAYGLRVPPPPT